jgi:hypothetical protein
MQLRITTSPCSLTRVFAPRSGSLALPDYATASTLLITYTVTLPCSKVIDRWETSPSTPLGHFKGSCERQRPLAVSLPPSSPSVEFHPAATLPLEILAIRMSRISFRLRTNLTNSMPPQPVMRTNNKAQPEPIVYDNDVFSNIKL